MQLIDILNYAVETTGLGKRGEIDADLKNTLLDMFNIAYEEIWKMYPWTDSKEIEVSITTTDGIVVFPEYVNEVLAVRRGTTPLLPTNEIYVNNYDPGDFDTAGSAYEFYYMPSRAVITQLTAAGVVKAASSSASDTTEIVRFEGLLNDQVVSEQVTLNGVTAAATTQTFDRIRQISKERTVGRISIKNASDTEIASINPVFRKSEYKTIRLVPIVDSSTTIKAHCRKRFEPLTSDYDSVMIDIAETGIIDKFRAEIYLSLLDNESMHSRMMDKSSEALQIAVNQQDNINATDLSFYPESGYFGDWNYRQDPRHVELKTIW